MLRARPDDADGAAPPTDLSTVPADSAPAEEGETAVVVSVGEGEDQPLAAAVGVSKKETGSPEAVAETEGVAAEADADADADADAAAGTAGAAAAAAEDDANASSSPAGDGAVGEEGCFAGNHKGGGGGGIVKVFKKWFRKDSKRLSRKNSKKEAAAKKSGSGETVATEGDEHEIAGEENFLAGAAMEPEAEVSAVEISGKFLRPPSRPCGGGGPLCWCREVDKGEVREANAAESFRGCGRAAAAALSCFWDFRAVRNAFLLS